MPHPLTPARIALGQTGPAIPTREHLRFQLDHALARDAVHARLDVPTLLRELSTRSLNPVALRSHATRETYLRRPDLGRTLAPESAAALLEAARPGAPCPDSRTWVPTIEPPTLAIILADGLSALAVDRHALPLLDATLPLLEHERLAPIAIVTQARVAIGDPIGAILRAQLTLLFIGERPGLSSPDSLGVYLTWAPRPGRTDAERNCISNIRHEGLSYADAARRIAYYLHGARQLQATGIALKETTSLSSEKTTPAPSISSN